MRVEDYNKQLEHLKGSITGDIFTDNISKLIYATDASAYREIPLAVIRPKDKEDIVKIIEFADTNKLSIIPRTAGTSLAGQVVGGGIVVDVSKYMTNIIELNQKESWIKVQPGVVLDELNKYLYPYGLFFGPETSTSNRCMIGGMVGNNSAGSHSLIYGSTRDHVISINAILSDGSEVEFKELSKDEFNAKLTGNTLESRIYKNINDILSDKENQVEIREQYPDKEIKRRNTGYAIDLLLETEPFTDGSEKFNFCKLICGSEGTLAFMTEIKLNLIPLPPKEEALICVHLNSIEEALKANLIALKYNPGAIELIDNVIIECAKSNIEQTRNSFFINGNPGSILFVEFARESKDSINDIKAKLEVEMRANGFGFDFTVLYGADIKKAWNLRKAGLGLLSNIPGDRKPVPVIEDTAVNPNVLPEYVSEFQQILKRYDLSCVYYAHIATGELHLRPVLNLKDAADVELFHTVALEMAKLVKKFKGSLSGEHGDGRLRGEFIPLMIGEKNYALLKQLKQVWDINNIFNPNKIVDTPKMNSSLRYKPNQVTKEFKTIFNFNKTQGLLRAIENCNGSGDCRKSEIIGGTMCPSFMATRNENSTTRARANILREILTNSDKANPFDSKEIYEIMDLCISCKGCKSECPSGIDMAKLKAEFLQHYYYSNVIPLRTKAIAYITMINKLGMIMPALTNFFLSNSFTSSVIKKSLSFAPKRTMPTLYKTTLKYWLKSNQTFKSNKKVYLFADEFTNYNDVEIGIKAIKLLNKLGYQVEIPKHIESGRTFISKGLISKAKEIAIKNINLLNGVITKETPLLGIEPSAILTFRDEYPDLINSDLSFASETLANNTFLVDEFISSEIKKGNISKDSFTKEKQHIKLHGHCQQKSIASTESTKFMLSFPENYSIEEIKSGCCGMAGSFGYEKEHYDISMKIGELVLFPEIRKTEDKVIIAASGTSCRCQIKDGTNRDAKHPVEILYDALV